MCGIIGVLKKQSTGKKSTQVAEAIHEIFEDQAGRGTLGFGIAKIGNDKTITTKRSTQLISALLNLRFDCIGAKGILMHHRQPTSSPNKISQTHPIFIKNPLLNHNYLVVHNGVLHNEKERKEEHEKLGFAYTTQLKEKEKGFPNDFNDSESIAIDFVMAIEGLEKTIKSRGSAALVAIQMDKTTSKAIKIHLWRGTNPLNFLETEEAFFFSSMGPGEPLLSETLLSIDLETNETLEVKLEQDTYQSTYVPSHSTPQYTKPESTIGYRTEPAKSTVLNQTTKTHMELMEEELDEEEKWRNEQGEVNWDKVLENSKAELVLDDLDDNGETQQTALNKVEELFIALESAEEIWTLEAKKELQKTLSAVAKLFLTKYDRGLQTVTEALKVYQMTKDDKQEKIDTEYHTSEWHWSKKLCSFYGKNEEDQYIDMQGVLLTNEEIKVIEKEEKEKETEILHFSHGLQRFYRRDEDGILRDVGGDQYDEESVRIIEEEEAYDEEYAHSIRGGS